MQSALNVLQDNNPSSSDSEIAEKSISLIWRVAAPTEPDVQRMLSFR